MSDQRSSINQRFSINLTMSDIEELHERILNADDGEQEIVFEWRMIDEDGDQAELTISVGDDE